MKTKRLIAAVAIILILAIGIIFFISSGFQTRTDVCLTNYVVSEDGSSITINTLLADSMGCARAIKTERDGNAVYCSFYCSFGGLISGIGGRSRYQINLDPSSTEIYFDRGGAGWTLVLQKDEATDTWVEPQRK